MRSWRSRCSALLLCLALSLGFAALSPIEARADLIDICNTPGMSIKDHSYDTSADLTDEDDPFRQYVVSQLTCNPFTTERTGNTDYVTVVTLQPVLREDIPKVLENTAYISAHTTRGYEVMRTSAAWKMPVRQEMFAYIAIDMFESPLPAGSRITFDGFQAPFVPSSVDVETDGLNWWSTWVGTGDNVTVWYSNSRQANTAKLANYNNTMGFYELNDGARYIYIAFRLRFNKAITNELADSHIYYLNRLHVYWQLIGADTVSTNNTIDQQTQTMMDTTGSDTVTGDTTSQYTQQIENLSLIQGLEGIQQQLHEALTTTESDTTVVFPGVNLMGFTVPSYEIDPLDVSPIPPDTIRGFLTFVFVCWYIAYMRNLVANIFNLRWYNYDGEIYDEGTVTGRDNPNGNWGLVE